MKQIQCDIGFWKHLFKSAIWNLLCDMLALYIPGLLQWCIVTYVINSFSCIMKSNIFSILFYSDFCLNCMFQWRIYITTSFLICRMIHNISFPVHQGMWNQFQKCSAHSRDSVWDLFDVRQHLVCVVYRMYTYNTQKYSNNTFRQHERAKNIYLHICISYYVLKHWLY